MVLPTTFKNVVTNCSFLLFLNKDWRSTPQGQIPLLLHARRVFAKNIYVSLLHRFMTVDILIVTKSDLDKVSVWLIGCSRFKKLFRIIFMSSAARNHRFPVLSSSVYFTMGLPVLRYTFRGQYLRPLGCPRTTTLRTMSPPVHCQLQANRFATSWDISQVQVPDGSHLWFDHIETSWVNNFSRRSLITVSNRVWNIYYLKTYIQALRWFY